MEVDLRSLLHRISDDVKTLARDEIELVRADVRLGARAAAVDAAAILLGALVALIGLAMLCGAAVAALAPVLPPLWARLLVMAGVYLALGGTVAATFRAKLRGDARPHMAVTRYEARRTARGIAGALGATEGASHA
jgi:hypothetical protein